MRRKRTKLAQSGAARRPRKANGAVEIGDIGHEFCISNHLGNCQSVATCHGGEHGAHLNSGRWCVCRRFQAAGISILNEVTIQTISEFSESPEPAFKHFLIGPDLKLKLFNLFSLMFKQLCNSIDVTTCLDTLQLYLSGCVSAAMALIDSTASFGKRCTDVDSTGSLFDGLKAQGVRSFSALAFTIGTPQSAPSDRQYDDSAVKVFGADPTLGQVASLRRLHFEFTTLIVATLIEQVKSDSAEPGSLVKKLPAAEKQARLEKQQERLAGIKMVGEMAPSHQLIDLVNSILETGAIVWVAPSRCS